MFQRSIRDTIDLINSVLDQKGEQLHERDAGIREIVVGPGGKMLRNESLGFVYELLESSVVESGNGKGHVTTR